MQVQTYENVPFGKVDEEYIDAQLKNFSLEMKHFAERKRCGACGMKNMVINQIFYNDADPSYWRFMRVAKDDFTQLHLGHYSTIMIPALEDCILYPPSLDSAGETIDICETCDDYFNSSSTKYPSWILANHLTLLPLPDDLQDIRDTEIQLVSPILRTHNIATITSGFTDKNTFLRSHVYTYGVGDFLAVGTLPLDLLSSEAFNISIVGAYTSDIKALVANAYEIRPRKSLMLLALCTERNNAAIMSKTSHSIMEDINALASSMHILINILEFNSNFADMGVPNDSDLSAESHANMTNPHSRYRGK